MAAEDGIEHMVATPHANDRYFFDREYLTKVLAELQRRVGATPKLSLGCDFHLSYENMQAALEKPERYCIGSSRYMLAEPSNFSIPPQVDEWFGQVQCVELKPIITHPERNPILQQNPERVLQWVELGCLIQITSNAMTGAWGSRAKEMAEWLLKKKAVHFLATDSHDTQRRPPVLSAARNIVAKHFGERIAAALTELNPGAVVNGEPLPA